VEVVRTPVVRPPRVGLLVSANPVNETGNRWQAGLEFRPGICGRGGSWIPCETDPEERTATRGGAPVTYRPVGLMADDACSAVAIDFAETRQRAEDTLTVWTSAQLEAELWTGAIGDAAGFTNQRLASDDAEEVSTAPMGYVDALACLEAALADCNGGGVGMIHAPRSVTTHWKAEGLLDAQGDLRLTTHGNIVVPGAGYDGSRDAETPATDGSVWAYATGLVDVRLGEIQVLPETLQQAVSGVTRDNTVEVFAQRVAAAVFDPCCLLAVEVDGVVCGAGS